MSLFQIRHRFKTYRVQKLFRKYVDPELVAQVIANPAYVPKPVEADVLLLVIDIRFPPIETLNSRFDKVIQAVRAADGMLESFMSTMALAVFPGMLNRGDAVPEAGKVTTAIMEALGSDVRLVWLRTSVLRGCIGKEHTHFGTVSPEILPAMQLLSTLEYGECRQFGG